MSCISAPGPAWLLQGRTHGTGDRTQWTRVGVEATALETDIDLERVQLDVDVDVDADTPPVVISEAESKTEEDGLAYIKVVRSGAARGGVADRQTYVEPQSLH
ncbi:hypothetical protein B0H14DRAFT_3168674 [Mycena olivaceomarginata]|nr:hypothetical protein B0H14DRAFT_3168674 [Mycena olivaceomarginata]